jgi:pentapeptide MXKDX repeat protein
VFVPGYDANGAQYSERQSGGHGRPGDPPGSWYGSSAGGEAGKGPVRGYPPIPGQPPPMYPPGQFSAWNRRRPGDQESPPPRPGSGPHEARTGPPPVPDGQRGAAGPRGYYGNDDSEPGYSVLAVSDPAADVTSTQTWKAVAEGRATGTWTMPPAPEQGSPGPGTSAPGTRPPSLPRREPGSHRLAAAAPRDGAVRDDVARDGMTRDGAVRDGMTRDGRARDGMTRDGMTRGGAVRDGMARPGVTREDPARDAARPALAASPATVRPTARRPGTSAPAADPGTPGGRAASDRRANDGPTAGRPASGRSASGRRGQVTAQLAASPDAPTAPSPPGGTRGRSGAHTGPHAMPRKRHGRGSVAVAMFSALLLVAGDATALYFGVLRSPAKTRPPAAQTTKRPSAPSPSPSPSPTLGPYGHIGTRTGDPQPLTIAQLYPAKFAASGGTVTRTADRIGHGCGGAVVGSSLQSALSTAGCDQVARATYIAPKRGLMGTIGVLNLKSGSAAKAAARAAGANNYIAQVPGRKGPTRKIGQGTGVEEFTAKGHYLILIWAEFTDLRKPKTAGQRTELGTFMNDLLDKTANISLTNRMLTGKP